MKNYYDELEVSRNASPEIINRAYKVLAKKYHPDTTKENKQEAEERFKKISEAYETLSDEQKRNEYNNSLQPEIDINDYNKLLEDNQKLANEVFNLKSRIDNLSTQQNTTYYNIPNQNISNNFGNQNINRQSQTNNQTVYNRVVYNRPTKKYSYFDILRYKINILLKNALALFLTIALIFIIISVLLYIPSTRDYILNDLHFGNFLNLFN